MSVIDWNAAMKRIGKVTLVGAGPGDPELLTLKAQRIISECPVCLYAGSLVPPEVVAGAPEGARVLDTAPMTLDATESRIERIMPNPWITTAETRLVMTKTTSASRSVNPAAPLDRRFPPGDSTIVRSDG